VPEAQRSYQEPPSPGLSESDIFHATGPRLLSVRWICVDELREEG